MKIAFCTPFKPVDHPKISGDVTIARDLVDALRGHGHDVVLLPHFPAKNIPLEPRRWAGACLAIDRMTKAAKDADCVLTYGTYYKVPDIFGPAISRRLGIPYFIFQASYAENRRKRLATRPGYELNRRAMLRADHIFCNRVNDVAGCRKLLPDYRFTYVKPGLPVKMFGHDETARKRLRAKWGVSATPVIMSTAMMRPGVKTTGLEWVIDTCAALRQRGREFSLVIAGDGPGRKKLERLASERLDGRVHFLGLVDRADLSGVFSAADLFAFPGLEESVGMVYLEAQQCGLPVVATDDEGAPHVIDDGVSGIITATDRDAFTDAVDRLLSDTVLRQQLGAQAPTYVQTNHDSSTSYGILTETMKSIVRKGKA